MSMPRVDVLITTIGRPSLEQAVLAGLRQSYADCRVVIISDGECARARQATLAMSNASIHEPPVLYTETPKRFGAGNLAKHWWINSGQASPWIRTCDDDDWIPPDSVKHMMAQVQDDTVLVMAPTMTLQNFAGRPVKYRVTRGVLVPDQCGFGSALFNTEAAQGIPLPHAKAADCKFLQAIAAKGHVGRVNAPMYWYNGYRTDASRGYGQGAAT